MVDNVVKPAPDGGDTGTDLDQNLLRTLYDAGFTNPQSLSQAYAIAKTESNGRSAAFNPNRDTGDRSLGMFQLNMLGDLGTNRNAKFKQYVPGYKTETDLFNPLVNARAAAYMTQQKKGNNDWSSWAKDLTSQRYKSFLPTNTAVKQQIGGFQKADAGMDFLKSRKTYFDTGAAAKEGYIAPSVATPYGGSYKIPGSYRSDPDTANPNQKFTRQMGAGAVGKITGPSGNRQASSTGSIGAVDYSKDGNVSGNDSWMNKGIGALNTAASPQFQSVGLGSQTFGKVF